MRIFVYKPLKSAKRYEFRYKSEALEGEAAFGYEAINFEILHSEIWDSIYPLCFLTRHGGPIEGHRDRRVVVQLEYPILESAVALLTQRAKDFGLDVEFDCRTYDRSFDLRLGRRPVVRRRRFLEVYQDYARVPDETVDFRVAVPPCERAAEPKSPS